MSVIDSAAAFADFQLAGSTVAIEGFGKVGGALAGLLAEAGAKVIAVSTSRKISESLFISIKTVGTHKQHILKKLDLKTNADMVKYALREGLTSL